jgi:hypothetical protein
MKKHKINKFKNFKDSDFDGIDLNRRRKANKPSRETQLRDKKV